MKPNKILSLALIITLIVGAISTANAQNINIIPEPYQITKGMGTYTLPKSIAINAPSSANAISDIMAGKLRTTTGRVVYFTKNKPSIDLQIINDANLGAELDELTTEQAAYLGIPVAGPFKADAYRY